MKTRVEVFMDKKGLYMMLWDMLIYGVRVGMGLHIMNGYKVSGFNIPRRLVCS